jgi:hypothetical protein
MMHEIWIVTVSALVTVAAATIVFAFRRQQRCHGWRVAHPRGAIIGAEW